MADQQIKLLEKAIKEIQDQAEKFGLDFFPMRFELCPADILYTFGAYGMPTRFSHWSFGKAFYRLKTQYDYNLSRIYELIINSDPCYAFLLDGNSLLQNKLVIAHVFAHSDFFKNNVHFAHTNRQMVETMAVHAQRIREYEFKYGRNEVEIFLDAVLALQEHINPYRLIKEPERQKPAEENKPETPYDDLWSLEDKDEPKLPVKEKKFPAEPEKDLLQFLMQHGHYLEDWQRDIIAMVREEVLYFWPQLETKIMNEGWATYWHVRIIRALDLSEEEAVEFAKMHSQVVQPSRMSLNPYLLGMKIFESIEKRWDQENKGESGREKIFEVRELENDISFIRNYLTEELVEELDLYLYQKVGHEWKIVEKDWIKVREGIVNKLVNCGYPYIVVEDGDYLGKGELYLRHCYEDRELDVPYLEKTLPYVYLLWGKPVHLETVIEGTTILFTYDGRKNSRQILRKDKK
ncbi:SpoVR family protein [Calderihabitans maritimus]|uniref:Stage V sporulation protein R n=1 Tax=Calderihabitans maritimus TaxID=1246530 RepID=A0A1Z5HP15_9FIRM|nr:SpoVR family protein [Calderihabitans maritimus]GAW91263.1 hypothetical protein Moth_0512 [Calderihabitans maritimus]